MSEDNSTAHSVVIDGLYKIFGDEPKEALRLAETGLDRQEIQEQSGQLLALRDISLSVNEGEIFVIMGLSGSGKSTLLRCVNRLHEPTFGQIKVRGQDISVLSHKELLDFRRKTFGMVFQNFALFPNRSVLENVEFGLEIQGKPKEERHRLCREAVGKVGLQGWEDKHTSELSGGMQQRVGLARALAVNPHILLMDEPFSALDPVIRTHLQDELLSLHQGQPKTILFVTHDLNEAIRLGDRIAILDSQGRLVQLGKPKEIILHPADEYVEEFVQDVDRPAALRVESAMRKAPCILNDDMSSEQAAETMRRNHVDFAPVLNNSNRDEGNLLGMVGLRDLEKGESGRLKKFVVDVPSVAATDRIKDILPYILESDDIVLPVMGEEGSLEGVVGCGDVARLLKEA